MYSQGRVASGVNLWRGTLQLEVSPDLREMRFLSTCRLRFSGKSGAHTEGLLAIDRKYFRAHLCFLLGIATWGIDFRIVLFYFLIVNPHILSPRFLYTSSNGYSSLCE